MKLAISSKAIASAMAKRLETNAAKYFASTGKRWTSSEMARESANLAKTYQRSGKRLMDAKSMKGTGELGSNVHYTIGAGQRLNTGRKFTANNTAATDNMMNRINVSKPFTDAQTSFNRANTMKQLKQYGAVAGGGGLLGAGMAMADKHKQSPQTTGNPYSQQYAMQNRPYQQRY